MAEKYEQISQMKSKLKPKRVEVSFDATQGINLKGINCNKPKSKFEAIYLMDSANIQIYLDGLPLSLQEVYHYLLDSDHDIDSYHVYSHLRRAGFNVEYIDSVNQNLAKEKEPSEIEHESPPCKLFKLDDSPVASGSKQYSLPSHLESCRDDWSRLKTFKRDQLKLEVIDTSATDVHQLPTGQFYENSSKCQPLLNPANGLFRPQEIYSRLRSSGPKDLAEHDLDTRRSPVSYTRFKISKSSDKTSYRMVFVIHFQSNELDFNAISNFKRLSNGESFVIAVAIDGIIQMIEYGISKIDRNNSVQFKLNSVLGNKLGP